MAAKSSLLLWFFFLFLAGTVFAQGLVPLKLDPKNRAVFSLGYNFIPKGTKLGNREAEDGFFVPTVGFDYFRKLHARWEIGLMWDWELDHYFIKSEDLERERAMIFTLVGNFKLTEKWAVFAGLGPELEEHRNQAVFRIGTEYAMVMGNNWKFVPALSCDLKNGYSTWSASVGFGKFF